MFTSQKFNQSKLAYNKSNYVNVMEIITPDVYIEEDINLSGLGTDLLRNVINSHLTIASIISSVIYVSSLAGTIYSSTTNISGIMPFFVKQNNLTEVTLDSFEHDILIPLGQTFRNFSTSADFAAYLPSLLSSIRLNGPTARFTSDTNASAAHKYLIDNLGWVYFLNTSGRGNLAYQPSSYVSSLLVNNLYRGQPILINDGIKGLTEHIWKNYSTCSIFSTNNLIPTEYLPSAFLTASSDYTSGVQQLEKLQTLIDIIYSPLHIDSADTTVRDAFLSYFSGAPNYPLTSKGPFHRLLRAFSYAFADYNDRVESLTLLYDLEQCPDDLLPELATLIGWKLFGSDPNRWRLQLLNAVGIYKRTGTLQSIQVAVNSLYTQDVFNVSSSIYELWESYVPNLIYYALATESSYFKDFTTWTPRLASEMLVSGYSISSMDENMRMVVDTILYDLVKTFPENFLIGKSLFPLNNPNFVFNYRGRNMPIPPFEEIPYYSNSVITEKVIVKIVDKLACFGVRKAFALQVGEYIKNNTVRAYDDIRVGNSYLMFTSGVQFPPNWGTILTNLSQSREEILSLWNGKSSHYKLIFEASSFDFAKDSLDVDSRNAVIEASIIANSFAPAHAIQDIRFLASIPAAISNEYQGNSALNRYFWRTEADSILDYNIGTTSATVISTVPRNNWRRRNFKNLLPLKGFYTRDGFNSPIGMYPSSTEYSYVSSLGYLPLGYIPSAGKFMPIAQYSAIPLVYSFCENLRSSSVFSGVSTSNTFPCRGSYPLGSFTQFSTDVVSVTANSVSSDYYLDRGELNPIIATMHWIKEEQKKKISEFEVLNSSSLTREENWLNVSSSLANSSTDTARNFPASFSDYTDFTFGKRIHDLYKDYTDYLGKHSTTPLIMDTHGNNIFGYAYGSIFENSEFKNIKSLLTNFPQYYASSTAVARPLNPRTLFNMVGIGSQPLETNSATDIIVSGFSTPTKEWNAWDVLQGIQFLQTSGGSEENSFTLFNLSQDYSVADNEEANYVINNPLIKIKAVDGFPRLRLANNPISDSEAYTPSGFKLLPNHKYKLELKTLACNEQGTVFGGAKLGVWIHTKPESGYSWSWNPNLEKWQLNTRSDFTAKYVLKNLTKIFDFEEIIRKLDAEVSAINPYRCIETVKNVNEKNNFDVIRSFIEKDFTTLEVDFDTLNKPILAEDAYYKLYGEVHAATRDYNIEIFMLPDSTKEHFILLDNLNLYSRTERDRTHYIASGIPSDVPFGEYCTESYVQIGKQHLLNIIKYFNSLTLQLPTVSFGPASRLNSYTDDNLTIFTNTVFEVSGGSRLNYRTHPDKQAEDVETIFNTYKTITIIN